MRRRALLLAIPLGFLPVCAMAQNPPAPSAPPAGAQPAQAPAAAAADQAEHEPLPTTFGSVDFGVRGTSTTGDPARYERYRDMSDGLFLERGRFSTQKNGWLMDFGADHLGRKDQRYSGTFVKPGQVKAYAQWDQIPMLISSKDTSSTDTLFLVPGIGTGTLQIDDGTQLAVQNNVNALKTIPRERITIDSRRHVFTGGIMYMANRDSKNGLSIDANVRQIDRNGSIPYGGSFGHGSVEETLAPVKHSTTDFDTTAEYQQGNFLARGGYRGSWFTNDNTTLTFDNVFRLSDTAATPGRGRTSLAPSNSFLGVNGYVAYKLPAKSRVSLYASSGWLSDAGAALMPNSINSANPVVPLDRPTVDGKADTSSLNFAFTSRPSRMMDIDIRYRTYDYDNKTPEYFAPVRVAYDNAPAANTNPALQYSEPFGVKRENFDADVRLSPGSTRFVTAGVGYSHIGEDRTHRIFESTSEDVVRVVVDSVRSRFLTVRSKYEHSDKDGHGNVAAITDELFAIGEQPGMRHFDIAARTRDRGSILVTFIPSNSWSLNASFAGGKDNFKDSGEYVYNTGVRSTETFGMRDNSHKIYSAGVEIAPSEYLTAGLAYSYERYKWLANSREAGGPPSTSPDFYNPLRDWSQDSSDKGNTIVGHFEARQLVQNWDVLLFADHSSTRGTYFYAVPTGSTISPPIDQLPDVTSKLTRVNLDVIRSLSERWSLGFTVWYEKYDVDDFTFDIEAQEKTNPTNGMLLGYTYAPYTAATYWGRVIYKF